jgi:hypothetical protein
MGIGLLIGAVLGVGFGGCAPLGHGGGGTGGRGIAGIGGNGGAHANYVVPAALNSQLDIVFMIDNSSSMLPLQAKFIEAIPAFMNTLKTVPHVAGANPGLPDVHIGVVSSDTGPGKFDLPQSHCPFGGDHGQFQSVPRGTCVASPFKNVSDHFLSASMNQTITNYTGDIGNALACIAALGDQGCTFEGQLKSVRWALDPFNLPSSNEGFLRLDAALAVILLTNEDDCSVPDDSSLLDPTASQVSVYGPFKSFRCNEFGHLCNVGGKLAPPPKSGAVSSLTGCVSDDTTTGKLTNLGDEIAFLASLKTQPNRVFVAAMTGPPTPYGVMPDADGDQSVVHSCAQSSAEYADPAVRIQQWVAGFGDHGLQETICAPSFSPAMSQIAGELVKLVGPTCLPANLVDTDPGTSAIDADCRVEDSYVNAGKSVITPLPSCAANGNTPPCWQLVSDSTLCGGSGLLPVITRDPTMQLPNGLVTFFSCAQCVAGRVTPGCP